MERFDASTELAAFAQAADEVVRILSADARTLGARISPVSGWSAVEHASHVTLANELVLRNLVNLSRGAGLLVVADARQDDRALEILAAGILPRGQAKAPRMVVPPSDVDLATTREWAERFVEELAGFRRGFDPRATRARLFVPHQILGPLDLAEWARFGAVHTRHHLGIAREVLATRA
ncbi:MAG: DinB family protein [Planctomycetota bacterium]|nr:DinB family protein [Planctomycetota bacterium]